MQSLLQSLQRSGFAVEKSLWPASLTAETLPQLQSALAGLEKPLEEQYFAARQRADALTAEVQEKQAELASVSGGRWVYPHGDAATRVRDAVNAELKSRGMTPDAKIFCELLSVEDESWQDCVEACLGDRRFDILVPPAHYAAAKSAFVPCGTRSAPSACWTPPASARPTARPTPPLPTASPRRSEARTRWPHSMPTPSCGASSAVTPPTPWKTIPTALPATCCATTPSASSVSAHPSGISALTPAAPGPKR